MLNKNQTDAILIAKNMDLLMYIKNEEMSVTQIARTIGKDKSTISKKLKELEDAGFISSKAVSKEKHVKITDNASAILDAIEEAQKRSAELENKIEFIFKKYMPKLFEKGGYVSSTKIGLTVAVLFKKEYGVPIERGEYFEKSLGHVLKKLKIQIIA